MPLRVFAFAATAVSLALFGCGADEAAKTPESPEGRPTSAEVAEVLPEEYVIWFEWMRSVTDYDMMYIDDRGDAFHYSSEGDRQPETLLVYRDVRLSPETLARLLSARRASSFSPGFDGSETLMTSHVICAHEGNCSVHLCSVHNDDLLDSYNELESALASSAGRSVSLDEGFEPISRGEPLITDDSCQVIGAWNLEEVRPRWLAEAWEQAGESEP